MLLPLTFYLFFFSSFFKTNNTAFFTSQKSIQINSIQFLGLVDDGGQALASLIQENTSIETLFVDFCGINDSAVKLMTAAFQSNEFSSIRSLSIRGILDLILFFI